MLPDGTKRSLAEIRATITAYRKDDPAVFDLYDMPNKPWSGPHDEVLEIDLLSLNAMNAWAAARP